MKFNLIEEKWIRVIKKDGNIAEYGIKDTFADMQNILSFGGEHRLQDTAMLRLFVALSVTMIYRYQTDGTRKEASNERELRERFATIYKKGEFPQRVLDSYFDEWHNRFYLIDEQYPFYQVPERSIRKEIKDPGKKSEEILYQLPDISGQYKTMNHKDASAINGLVLESGNKPSVYTDVNGTEKVSLSFAEAARWLVWYMNYADCGTKAPGKWASQMTFASSGTVMYGIGQNLFETVLQNSVLLKNGVMYEKVSPAWERTASLIVQDEPYGEAAPQNLPELYTQQSRRIILQEKEGRITDVYIIAGDKYSAVNAFIEPMFLWKADPKDKSGMTKTTLKYNTKSKWRNLQATLKHSDTCGVIQWIRELEDEEVLDEEQNIPFVLTGITYGTMQSVVDEMLFDEVIVNPSFFNDDEKADQMREMIDKINKVSTEMYKFGCRLQESEGSTSDSSKIKGEQIQTSFQNKAEVLFRKFMLGKMAKDKIYEDLKRISFSIIEEQFNSLGIWAFHSERLNIADAEVKVKKEIYKLLG